MRSPVTATTIADNAKKVDGATAAQIAATPGPAASAAGLLSIATGSFSLPAGNDTSTPGQTFSVTCPAGAKALTGGYSSQQNVQGADESISSDGATWTRPS